MTFNALSVCLVFALILAASINGASAQARIDAARAERIARQEVPNSTTESIERDYEDGRYVFEVELVTADGVEHEVVIDARDGRVLRVEVDD
ncbi:MAG: PepSY domain-containing protein [Deltaproteobacteria bacterium]|nr:PepSY domain-containing protein [Deltaproteobacteria bacterium]